jgi:ubiquinone/menaquinone biosynthesis C-methylase UbiE
MTTDHRSKPVRHPLFARFYARLTQHESAEMLTHRRELLSELTGRVLEVGAGAGTNFNYYPAGVTEVLAVEPEPYLRRKARSAASQVPVTITLLDGTAEQLPVEDGSCDAAIASLVLCSVPDQAVALAELRRVLRPGGELRFYEHVLSYKPRIARTQHFVDRVFWPKAFGGCHTARDTPAAIEAAGFEIEQQRRLWLAPVPIVLPVATHVLGRARRR